MFFSHLIWIIFIEHSTYAMSNAVTLLQRCLLTEHCLRLCYILIFQELSQMPQNKTTRNRKSGKLGK